MNRSDNELKELPRPDVPVAKNDKLRWDDLKDPDRAIAVTVFMAGARLNDQVDLYWKDPTTPIDSDAVVQDDVTNGSKSMKVMPIDIIERLGPDEPFYGEHQVFYTITTFLGGGVSPSFERTITTRIIVPGGYDTDPNTPGVNENLKEPQDIPDLVQETDLPLSVRIDPYDNMREGDVIRLSWNGHYFVHAPLTAGEVDSPVFFILTLDDFVGTPFLPGPGAGVGQIVRYDVHDIVDNWSLWSKDAVTDVEVGPDQLFPPRAPDWPARIIDLAQLGTADVRIEVPGGGLQDNDSVELFWSGRTVDGAPINDQQTKPVPVGDGGYSLFFTIDNRIVTAIPQGSARVRYEVTRTGTPRPLGSKTLTLSVIGVVQQLPPPTLRENNGGVVDPNLVPATGALATVLEYTPLMQEGDTIILCGDGLKSDTSPLPYRSPPKPVFANMVGTNVEFPLDKSYLQELAGGTLDLYYQINLISGPPQQESAKLPLTILGQPSRLPEPSVDFESGGKLDPALVPNGTTARVPAEAKTENRDRVYIYWRGNGPANSFDTSFPIGAGSAGDEVPFPVLVQYITGNLGRSVTVDYEVERPDGSGNRIESRPLEFVVEAAESLPPPQVEGVQDGGTLNPDQVTQVWVRVLGAGLVVGDYVTVTWTDNSGVVTPPYRSEELPYTTTDASNGFLRFSIPLADVRRFLDKTVSVTYERDRNGAITGPSAPFTLSIAVPLPLEPFTVMGARYNRTIYRASGCSRVLSALHTGTQQPLAVRWRYLGDGTWSAPTASWWDTQPSRALEVSSESHMATLNPANIFGSGDDTSLTGDAAFVAIRNGGDVVGWGNTLFGAAVPSGLSGIVEVSSTSAAFASRDGSGNVRVWGDPLRGAGDMGGLPANNFLDVCGNFNAFAGIKGTRQVVAWGAGRQGTLVPVGFQGYADVTVINAASRAFAIQRSGGPAVSWGEAGYGGDGYPANLTNVTEIMGSFAAFAVLLNSGTVQAWGELEYGGSLPGGLANVARLFCSNARAFCVQFTSRQIYGWGSAEYGGVVPDIIRAYTDIVEVSSTWRAFAARREGGEVVAWGRSNEGGTAPPGLTNVIQIAGSSEAFAALRRDGTVVAWGNGAVGGTIPGATAQRLVGVQALYANSHGFTALTASGDVVSWGHSGGGGNNDAVIGQLRNNVSYYRSPPVPTVSAPQAGRVFRAS
ncbi:MULTISPECIES: hypothetical protein [Pseudomonas]|uniref:RCC1 domain-containing protein n=1 Tax=Pseudomonas TaxID=286 RepID=UPI000CD4B2AF|nr:MULTISPECIES: hypothetical protein [Pseudomonas]RBH55529.1 hypothetical protein C3F00_018830 [Pseudomonas sp. MWU13-2860]